VKKGRNWRETGFGVQLYTRVRGRFVSEHVSEKPTAQAIREWVRGQHVSIKQGIARPEKGGDFEQRVAEYLESVAAMPSFSDRERDMKWWARAFRGRVPNALKPIEIRTRLERLRSTHAASSCNKKRTALMSFYTSLNGRSGYNPVRDVPKYREEEEMRAQHPMTVYRILSFMEPCQTRARLFVILWTGWPHAQLKRLKPEHLDLKNGRAYLTPRRKGKGTKGKWLPLLPQAVAALKEFIAWECFTPYDEKKKRLVPFSHSAMHSAFARALEKLNAHRAALGLPELSVRPYDLRHTFGTWLADRLTDDRAIQELMLHSRPEQTRRYTERATAERVARAVRQVASQLKSVGKRSA
jgi:integrase